MPQCRGHHRADEGRIEHEQQGEAHNRQEAEHAGRGARLRREGGHPLAQGGAFAHHPGEAEEHLAQGPPRLALHEDRRDEELRVDRAHARLEARERLAEIHPEPLLLSEAVELRAHRGGELLADELDSGRQGETRPDGVHDHVDGLGQLRLETLHAPAPAMRDDRRRGGRRDEDRGRPDTGSPPLPRGHAHDHQERRAQQVLADRPREIRLREGELEARHERQIVQDGIEERHRAPALVAHDVHGRPDAPAKRTEPLPRFHRLGEPVTVQRDIRREHQQHGGDKDDEEDEGIHRQTPATAGSTTLTPWTRSRSAKAGCVPVASNSPSTVPSGPMPRRAKR